MKIIYMFVEGKTETAFKPHLIAFLKTRLAGKMPKLEFRSQSGRVPKQDKLKRMVIDCLTDKRKPGDAVIALSDVYTGPAKEFPTAAIAKKLMWEWVGAEPRFHPHVALHDFEAWLLPYWSTIQRLTGSNRKSPGADPEKVNHGNSPAYRLKEIFETGKKSTSYVKARDAGRILKDQDLTVSIESCSEFKAFVNTIFRICDPTKVIP